MDLVAAFVRNPVKISVGVLLVLLFGGISLFGLPVQLVPEVQKPVISVTTPWPGASPQEVEREIVREQEEQLKGVEGVTKMSSESKDSMASVTLEFDVGTDMSEALLKVNSRLQQVPEYPEDALEPVIATSSSADSPIAWLILRQRMKTTEEIEAYQQQHPDLAQALEPARRAASTGLRYRRLEIAAAANPDLGELLPPPMDVTEKRRFAEDRIEARLERVGGVSNVNVFGGKQEELQVVVDPRRLAARAVTLPQLRLALSVRNHDVSAGDYWEGKRRYVVRTLGKFRTPEDVESVVVARRDGIPVHLRDVAEVRLGYRKPESMVFNFGTQCLAVNAVRETGANVLRVMDGLKEATAELNDGVLKDAGLYLEQVYDETEYIDSAIWLVKQNIFIGGFLTVIVLLLFLRSIRSTIIISLAIPTSVIGTFLLLGLMGRSLNVISLAGLAFAVGMLVDNAVVVLENIFRRYQMGERRVEAAVRGTQEVWGAVVASTMTTLAVFIPILFLKDEVGQLFGDIAVAISCAVGLSLVVSVTLIPTFTSRILPKRNRAADGTLKGEQTDLNVNAHVPRFLLPLVWPFDAVSRLFVGAVVGVHLWLQRGVLRQLLLIVIMIGGTAVLALSLMPKLEYLPKGNQNLAIALILPPPGLNLDELSEMGQTLDRRTEPYWNTDPDSPEAAALPFPTIRSNFFVAFGRQVFMGVGAHDPLRAGELVPLLFMAGRGLPGAFAIASQASIFERGLTNSGTIDIEIRGPDLRRLSGLGQRIMGMVSAPNVMPGAQAFPVPSLDLSAPEVHVVPRWERAADLGVTALDLGYTVNAFIDGAYAGEFFSGGDAIDLRLIGAPRYASRLQDLKDVPIATPAGSLVPLGAVADITLTSGPEQINHRERERTITIQVTPPADMPLEAAIDVVKASIVEPLEASGDIGGDYRITLGGTADKLAHTLDELGKSLILALIITYLLMAALFESWLYPLVVIVSVPLGAVGGLLGLKVLNVFHTQSLDTLTMIGFVILIGTVVNNAILIVHQALNNMRDREMDPKDAVRASVKSRIRPIFMTLFTTVFGLAPLVVIPGAGSELYRGIGSILIGGLVVSTVFTLFLVPTLFRVTLGARGALARLLRLA